MEKKTKTYSEDEYLKLIKSMTNDMQFGQISIIVQDGKVIQIEQTRKIRFKN